MPGGRPSRFARLGFTALLVTLLAGSARAELDHGSFQRLTASLLKVEAVNGDGSVSMGTGVVVARGTIATNCHVTRRARAIRLIRGAQRMGVESQYSDVERDLCLLYAADAEDLAAVEMDGGALRIGQPVVAAGFVFGIAPQLSAGEVKALHDYEGAQVIESSTPFGSGASGGGLFDAAGRLVGIVTFRSRKEAPQYYSLPVRWVLSALAEHHDADVQPLQGQPFWQRMPEAQPYFLRAATLEAEENWGEMADVARRWSDADAGNASSWLALGKARYRLSEMEPAIDALLRCARLAPDRAEPWYQLGMAYTAAGQNGAAKQARETLRRLSPDLAKRAPRHPLSTP